MTAARGRFLQQQGQRQGSSVRQIRTPLGFQTPALRTPLVPHLELEDPTQGRDGMAAEQVLRAGVLKQHTGASYERLAFGLADSSTYRSFCRIGFDKRPPTKSTLQKNVKRVTPETWETISRLLIKKAQEL